MNQHLCVSIHLNRFKLFSIYKRFLGADKYKPRTIKSLVGQQGEKSCVQKLIVWLRDWYKHHGRSDEKIKAKPSNGFNRNEDPALFKAALLSGPPGIG
jgi:replication factor C subunit 1